MGLIGNTIGDTVFVDLPISAGSNPTVSYTTDRVLDLVGINIRAAGATSAALTVDGVAVAAGDIAAFANDRGSVYAAAPTSGVPLATAGGGAPKANGTDVGNVNWQSSGTVQSGITDRNGSVPNPGAYTPLDAAIPVGKVVEVAITGDVTVLSSLPAPDGNGMITLPVGTTQDAANYVAGPDNLPFQVKASDTELDTFAGAVRLVFQVPFSDPNAAAKTAGTYPNNGIQKGSAY